MKHFYRAALVVVLLIAFAVPAFAVDERYTPELPPFITAGGGSASINIPIDKTSTPGLRSFFADFYEAPYLVLLEQWKAYGTEDKNWYLTFVKINTSGSGGSGGFQFNGGTNGSSTSGDYYIAPLRYIPPATGYSIAMYPYDFKSNSFSRPSVGGGASGNSVSPITFAYVVDSSPLSGVLKDYPYHNMLDGTHPFEVNYSVPRHYDWWLNINGELEEPEPPELDVDTDGDGIPDINIDSDKDGKPDINIDTNGDKKPDINIDSNGDGKPDTNIDSNGDGKPDTNIDSNGDGKPDVNIDSNGDGKPDTNIDSNGDGKPDINIDSNGDGKPDTNIDSNGDGKPDTNIDSNGDGKPDINIDTDGDGKPDVNIDSNGDGKPDTNLKPDGGGGSGGGSSGSGGGTGDPAYGDDWFDPDDGEYTYNDFPIFNPFDYNNYTPPAYNNPFTDYNPLKDHQFSYMPEIPKPVLPPWDGYNPFINPYK